MIKHIFTMIWHRKKSNALIIVELFFTFIILFSLISTSTYFYRLYSTPLGFNVENTWSVDFSSGGRFNLSDEAILEQLLTGLNQMVEVESAHSLMIPPFSSSGVITDMSFNGINQSISSNQSSDKALQALGVELIEGRWYGPEDDGQNWLPIVINRKYREEVFKDEDVLGKMLPQQEQQVGELSPRIVGVFEDFRQHGEFGDLDYYMFQRESAGATLFTSIVLILKPGVNNQFEEKLMATLLGLAGSYEFVITPWISLQENYFKFYMSMLLVGLVLASSLILMVGFGLLGVLWQNIIRRTPEIGLRRAIGAPANSVRSQIILELLAIASLGIVIGFLVVLQLPLTGIIPQMDWALFTPSVILTTVLLFGLCALFALYPSFQATQKEPVEALRYE